MANEYIVFSNKTQPAINDTNLNRLQQMIKQDIQGAISGDTLPVGAIMPFAGGTVPENWLLCDGRPVSREEYSGLFNTIGISYGAGDGFTTFNLPKFPYSSNTLIETNKEGNTDMFFDGKPVYVKKIDFGSLPNNGNKQVSIGLDMSTINIIDMKGYLKSRDTNAYYQFNWFSKNNDIRLTYSILPDGKIAVEASYDATLYDGYFTIYYTKKTDNTIKYNIIKVKQSAGIVAQVVDNLNSTSPTNALSANMGRNLVLRVTTGQEVALNEYIDNKRVYMKQVKGTISNTTGIELSLGLYQTSYTPLRFEAFFTNPDTKNTFNVNTPRGEVQGGVSQYQTFGYWDGANDKFIVVTNADRKNAVVTVRVYYTKN